MTGATGKRAADAEPAQPKAAAAKRAKGTTAEEAPENEERPPKPKPVVPEVIEPTAAAEVDVDIGLAPEWPEVLTVLTSKTCGHLNQHLPCDLLPGRLLEHHGRHREMGSPSACILLLSLVTLRCSARCARLCLSGLASWRMRTRSQKSFGKPSLSTSRRS